MEGVRVRFRGIGASVFKAAAPRALAINIPGLPGRMHATPIVPTLLEAGYDVLQLQYYGTYDSEGAFDPRRAHQTIIDAVEALRSGEVVEFGTNTQVVGDRPPRLLVAHSFGTYVALRALMAGAQFEKVLLFSPMLRLGRWSAVDGLELDLHAHVARIAEVLPLTHRIVSAEDLRRFFIEDEWIPSAPVGTPRFGLFVGTEDPSLNDQVALDAAKATLQEVYGDQSLDVLAHSIRGAGHGVDSMVERGGRRIRKFIGR